MVALAELDLSAQSVQSLPRHYHDFKCFELFYVFNAVVNYLQVTNVNSSLFFTYCNFLESFVSFRVFIVVVSFSTFILIFIIVLYCNYFYTTPQALSVKSYRVLIKDMMVKMMIMMMKLT